jgi:hypothetical protein
VEKNFISKHGYLEKEQVRIEQEADLQTQKSRLKELAAAIDEARGQRNSAVAETRRLALDTLNEAEQKATAFGQELVKSDTRGKLMTLTAPVDGTVQQLAVRTVGGVVTEAQVLMVIVPKDDALEVEAFLENKDIGFVNAGQEAEVKIETFPFTKLRHHPRQPHPCLARRHQRRETRPDLLHPRPLAARHHAGGGQDGESQRRHGGEPGDQDRQAPGDRVFPEPAAAAGQREFAGAVMNAIAKSRVQSFRVRRTAPLTTPSPVDIERAQELIHAEDRTRQAAGKTQQILVAGHQRIGLARQRQFQKGHVECASRQGGVAGGGEGMRTVLQ